MPERNDYEFEDAQIWFRKSWCAAAFAAMSASTFKLPNLLGVLFLIVTIIFLFLDLVIVQVAIERRDSEGE